jgi:hypothetical protein
MASFGEILNTFKKDDEPENIVAIINDDKLQNGMIAWKSVYIKYKAATDCTDKDPVAQWNWMWDQVEFDANKFGVVAGIKVQDIGAVLSRLKGLHLIYPDGSINRLAKQYLQSIIMSKIRAAQPRPAKQVTTVKTPATEKVENAE